MKINVENVENSKEDMITNSDGSFVLKGVSKAPVVLKAMLDGYDFDPIVIDKVEPNMELAVVQPTRFRYLITPAEAKIVCDKNVRALVSMVSYLKNCRKTIQGREKNVGVNPSHFRPKWGWIGCAI